MASPAFFTGLALGLGAALTVVILLTGWLPSGYHSRSLSVGLNTADGCVALLVAYLAHGRFVRDGLMRDRLLAHGLALLGVAALVLPTAVDLLGLTGLGTADAWASAVVRLIASLLILAGAATGEHVMQRRSRGWLPLLVPVGWLALVLAVVRMTGSSLPTALVPSPIGPGAPVGFSSNAVFAALQVAAAVAFLIAALAFGRRSELHVDDLADFMGPAFALGTFALVQYSLFPTVYSDWVYTGDLLRTGCYLLLLIGAAREIGRYWSAQTRAAVLQDRRRLAREIHDGVVQELAYIRMESQALLPETGQADRLIDACDRALDEARDAVHALAGSNDEPLDRALQRTAHDLSRRLGLQIELEARCPAEVDDEQRHAVVRIAREAISNAARHGRATRVQVRLAETDGQRLLEISDDGGGFDPATIGATSGGYGLTSMRERSDALPGSCVVESEPGRGTTVRVIW